MTTLSSDPVTATVQLRIQELRREASDLAVARRLRAQGPRREVWPAPVVRALRSTFVAAVDGASGRGRAQQPCPTC